VDPSASLGSSGNLKPS